jgi:hypothetical protein
MKRLFENQNEDPAVQKVVDTARLMMAQEIIPVKTKGEVLRNQRLNEAQEAGLTKKQFLFDTEVIKNMRNLSESEDFAYLDARNLYFTRQRNAAVKQGNMSVAEYYDNKIV